MAKYKDEGIGKLLDIYNNDLKGLIDRLDALKKAAEDSTTFSGAADGVESSVKYIYETAAIEKQTSNFYFPHIAKTPLDRNVRGGLCIYKRIICTKNGRDFSLRPFYIFYCLR